VEIASNEPGDGMIYDTGDEVLFLLQVENVGDADATDVRVVIPLPENAEFVTARLRDEIAARSVPRNAKLADVQVVLTIGPVGVGEIVVVEVVLRAAAGGQGVITPVVSSAELPEGTPADQSAEFEVREDEDVLAFRGGSVAGCGLIGIAPAFVFLGLCLLHRLGNGRIHWHSPSRLAGSRRS